MSRARLRCGTRYSDYFVGISNISLFICVCERAHVYMRVCVRERMLASVVYEVAGNAGVTDFFFLKASEYLECCPQAFFFF